MSSPRPAPRPWPKWVPIAGWSILGVLAATLAVFVLTMTFGAVHGVEFSPQAFERRSYSFYELPLVGIQVTGIRHEDLTTAAESFLTTNKYVQAAKPKQDEWHIVVGSHGTRLQRRGDANILAKYLDATDADDDLRWVKWSEQNPKLAKVFWPAVQQLAKHELYVFLPDAFDLAKSHSDPKQLKTALDKLVAAKLLFLARRLQEREDHAEAARVLSEAAILAPQDKGISRAHETAKVAAAAQTKTKPAPSKEPAPSKAPAAKPPAKN